MSRRRRNEEAVEQLQTKIDELEHAREELEQRLASSEAARQANDAADDVRSRLEHVRDDVVPRARELADDTWKRGREGFERARHRVEDDVVPAARRIGRTVRDAEVTRHAKEAAQAAGRALASAPDAASDVLDAAREATEPSRSRRSSVGTALLWTGVGIGALALLALGTAAYRAVTLADEHWISIQDEEPGSAPAA